MKKLVQLGLTYFVVVILFYTIIFLLNVFSIKRTGYISDLSSLVAAIIFGILLWKKVGSISNNAPAYIFGMGFFVGGTGFILGFFGPILLLPENNMGPMLGIFCTGPLGFIVGLIMGGKAWESHKKNFSLQSAKNSGNIGA